MSAKSIFFVPVCVVLWTLWTTTVRRRKLQSTSELIQRLHPHMLHGISEYLCGYTQDEDLDFWLKSGQTGGMLARRHNAAILLHLCQSLAESGCIATEEVAFFSSRSWQINFFLLGASLEAGLRRVYPATPHTCAQIVASMYAETRARMKSIRERYNLPVLHELDAIL